MQKLRIIICLVLILNGCAHNSTDNQVFLTDALVFNLLPPDTFGQNLLLTQAVTVWFEEKLYDLLFYTEISAKAITIVGSLPGGIRLFSIVYDGQTIQSEGYMEVITRIKPEYFLADLQIAQWPFAEVSGSFAASNVCFKQGSCVLNETADHMQRSVSKDGKVMISIKYDGLPHYQHTTQYEHHLRHYRLRVETLAVEIL